MACLVLHLFAYIYCFFPLFSPVDPVTAANAAVIEYVDDDTSSFQQSFQAIPPF